MALTKDSRTQELLEKLGEFHQPFIEPTEDPDPGEAGSLIAARLKPKPPLNSGSIALPLPHDLELIECVA